MKGKIIPKEIKDEILEKIHRGEKVADLTKAYGLGQKTIYSWMSKTVNSSMNSLAIGHLKRENEALKVLVGELFLQVSKRGKKAGITKMLTSVIPKQNKTRISTKLGVSRSSLYYQPSKDQLDKQEKLIITQVMRDNPAYGHKRIAMHLHWGKNHVKRLMKKFNLKPARRRIQRAPRKPEDYHLEPASYYNFYKMYKELNQIDERGIFWRADFTYIKVKCGRVFKPFLFHFRISCQLKTGAPPKILFLN